MGTVAPGFKKLALNSGHLKANYATMPCKGCPNSKAPPNAAHKCSFFSLFLKDAPLWSFAASHIPRFFARPKNKKQREKMGDRNCDVKVKHLVTQPGNAPKTRPSHLTTADTVNKVSLKDSPSKNAKAGSFEGCRPWIETQQQSACRPLLQLWWTV